MRKSSLLYTGFALMLILGVAHFIAEAFYLYWIFWWLDIAMHLLAGFSGGLVLAWFFGPMSTARLMFLILIYMLVVGIAWEIFEYIYDLAQHIDYWQDTISDVINDEIGAALSCVYAIWRIPKSS